MVSSSNLGFPRIGANRELKRLVENFWSGKLDQKALLVGAKNLRLEHWKVQHAAGIDHIPSNDFSLYDQVLDHAHMLGAIPDRYSSLASDPLKQYFAMARGLQVKEESIDVPAMEMKKWFDTNYHYIVPEFHADQQFQLAAHPKPVAEFIEAKSAGIHTRPVLLGPISFLYLGKHSAGDKSGQLFNPLSLLDRVLPLYEVIVKSLVEAGAVWMQFDEPVLSLDLDVAKLSNDFVGAYTRLSGAVGPGKIMVANYFGRLGDNMEIARSLPVAGLHVDLVRAPEELEALLDAMPAGMTLSLGLVNGRNIWRADLDSCVAIVNAAVERLGTNRVIVAPSCSLLHSPFSLEAEKKMAPEIRLWMAFAAEKLQEIATIAKSVNFGSKSVAETLAENSQAVANRAASPLIHDAAVKKTMEAITPEMMQRQSPFAKRWVLQKERLKLPMFPTTTIGSFPQTKEVRVWRQNFKKNLVDQKQYRAFIESEIRKCVQLQEEIGMDVLVHGEPERNDMVEYFGENLKGYVFSENGWVQSYGSRCVKPPIIYGDVSRPLAMTVETIVYAQSQTKLPMKGMLTGPVTMLQWSFVRDDQPRRDTTFQLALAIRHEVQDLERAGIKVIQIDEPAIREGLPLRRSDWDNYLHWAVDSFLLCSTGVRDDTQIHSHFCYSDFNDIFPSIKRLDADVITIENARSDLKLLEAFAKHGYTNSIGPGVYDIHSPRVPSQAEMQQRLAELGKFVGNDLLWINPDCGLKTRGHCEVEASLRNMVSVARSMRAAAAGSTPSKAK